MCLKQDQWTRNGFGRSEKDKKNLLPLPGIEHMFLGQQLPDQGTD